MVSLEHFICVLHLLERFVQLWGLVTGTFLEEAHLLKQVCLIVEHGFFLALVAGDLQHEVVDLLGHLACFWAAFSQLLGFLDFFLKLVLHLLSNLVLLAFVGYQELRIHGLFLGLGQLGVKDILLSFQVLR